MSSAKLIQLANAHWQVEVTSHGGQILRAWHCNSPHPVIFCGRKAEILPGKAIRGGVPLCWPWFGAAGVAGRPIQGFARTAQWEVETGEKDFIRLVLPEANVPEELRDFPFELYSEIRLSEALEIALIMKNCGTVPADISCALHSYFAVSDCEKVTVSGLKETPFTVKGGAEETDSAEVLAIKGEVCRLYCPQSAVLTLHDPKWQRQIVIEKSSSDSTLVWNPGAERCAQIADLADDEYHDFLCIEANRAGSDTLRLLPETPVKISQKISCRFR